MFHLEDIRHWTSKSLKTEQMYKVLLAPNFLGGKTPTSMVDC